MNKKDSLGRERSPIVKRKDWGRIIARVGSEGKSIPQIAREEGCSERTLRRRCRAQGILKVTRRDEAETQIDTVLSLYKDGISCQKISNQLNLSRESVIQVVKESSLQWREGYEYSYVVVPGTDLEKDICSRYPERSLEDIADRYGIARKTIGDILRRAGKDILPRGPRSHRKGMCDA
jgi:DNA-binding CsgD family transcriptional regulator